MIVFRFLSTKVTQVPKTSAHTLSSPEAALLLSAQRIATSGKVQFSEHAKVIYGTNIKANAITSVKNPKKRAIQLLDHLDMKPGRPLMCFIKKADCYSRSLHMAGGK